jgi:ubiquitin-conjugating enzyme E2 Q
MSIGNMVWSTGEIIDLELEDDQPPAQRMQGRKPDTEPRRRCYIDLLGDDDDEVATPGAPARARVPAAPQTAPSVVQGVQRSAAKMGTGAPPAGQKLRGAKRLAGNEDGGSARAAKALARVPALAPAALPPVAPVAQHSAAKADAAKADAGAPPSWLKLSGVKRVMGELAAMRDLVSRKEVPIDNIEPVGDNAMCWQLQISKFDTALQGGRDLNADLAELKRKHGLDHVLIELRFPPNYPSTPFALRVVKPRMRWYTGHVTAGGSVCMELLTCSGTDNSWQSSFTVEGVLLVALTNMIDCESTIVKTDTGPGGRSGPLRIDLRGEFGQQPLVPYSEQEATAAFSRMVSHHSRHGW